MIDWWSLPGPAAFLARTMDALSDWSNVVVACPSSDASAVLNGVEQTLRSGDRDWRVGGPVLARTGYPIDEIADALQVRQDGDVRLSPAALIARLRGYEIVLVEGVTNVNWRVWKTFLADYEQAVRGVSAFERTVLVVVVGGVAREEMCKRAPALRTLVWDGVVGELDVLTYVVMSGLNHRSPTDRRARLVAKMICRLAAGDLEMAEALLQLDERQMFDPVGAIRMAGVTRANSEGNPRWETGELAIVDGEPLLHSAVLARDGDQEGVLSMRLWAAQAAEILPALEVNRRWLARRMRGSGLRMPVTVGDETINDLDDLEIGQLAFLAREKRLSPDIQRLASKWRRVRNKLAHLEPLSADEALDDELLAPRAVQRA